MPKFEMGKIGIWSLRAPLLASFCFGEVDGCGKRKLELILLFLIRFLCLRLWKNQIARCDHALDDTSPIC